MVINTEPTEFGQLNELLEELTVRAAVLLGLDFVGAYLLGAFADGDADENSNISFVIPTHGAMTLSQERRLRVMHTELARREVSWAQQLEGCYPPTEELRTLDGLDRAWLHVGVGAPEMDLSSSCNTAALRWALRERGLVLAGPHPSGLVHPIAPEDLR